MAITLKSVREEIQDIVRDDQWQGGAGVATFNSSGLDDMSTGGQYTGVATKLKIKITIDATGTPDTFTWAWSTDGGNSYTNGATGVSCSSSGSTLTTPATGVVVTFTATTGHTNANNWEFQVHKPLYSARLLSMINDAQLEVAELIDIKRAMTNGTITTAGAKATGETISFADSNPDTILDSASGFGDFVAGQEVVVLGSTSNDGRYTIATAVAGTITLTSAASLTAEAAGADITIVSYHIYDLPSNFLKFSPTTYIHVTGNNEISVLTRDALNVIDPDHTDVTTATSGPSEVFFEESQVGIHPLWTGVLRLRDYYAIPTELSADTDTINIVSDGISGDRVVKNAIVASVCARVFFEWLNKPELGRTHSANKKTMLRKIRTKYSHDSDGRFTHSAYRNRNA